jgi:TPR repeat protein
MSQPFLFVSHVTEDRAAATELVTELERRGIGCWVAPRDVRAGKPYDDEIAEAIDDCAAMLLVFSERCNESEYIRREITVAGEARKLIIPFRIENAQPKRGLRIRLADLHWIDGFIAREQAIDALIRSVIPKPTDRPRPEDIEGVDLPTTSPALPAEALGTGQWSSAPVSSKVRALAESASGPFVSPLERDLHLREASADPEDQFMAGVMHRLGYASPESWEEALPFLHRAAAQGHAGAEHQIGLSFLEGTSTQQQERDAAGWFSRAAAKNHTPALCDLARLYEGGRGVGRDTEKALELYRQAARSGAFWAERDEERLSGRTPESVPVPFADCDASLVVAEGAIPTFTERVNLTIAGWALDAGLLPPTGFDRINLDTVAPLAAGGDAYAQFALGYTHHHNEQHPQARHWLQRSAVQGFAAAQRIVAEYYWGAFDMKQNKLEALDWLKRAARSGSTMALLNLADKHLWGDIPPRDPKRTIFLCDEVIARGKYFVAAYGTRKYAVTKLTES